MNASLVTALQLMDRYSARPGYFDAWDLAGPHKAQARQAVMLALTGSKLPQSKCGVTAIRALLWQELGAEGDCIAVRDRDAGIKARALLGIPHPFAKYDPTLV